jgi:hypothetical protein
MTESAANVVALQLTRMEDIALAYGILLDHETDIARDCGCHVLAASSYAMPKRTWRDD